MSQENVEIVRRGYDHFIATGELLPEIAHPDFAWDMSTFRGWPEQQIYHGVEGTREFLTEWVGAWDDWKLETEQFVDAGDEKVVVILRQTGRSKATGVHTEMHFGQLWTLKGEKQLRMQMYASPAEALEAAGLKKE